MIPCVVIQTIMNGRPPCHLSQVIFEPARRNDIVHILFLLLSISFVSKEAEDRKESRISRF